MFGKTYDKYYRIFGKEYSPQELAENKETGPSKIKSHSWDDTGWDAEYDGYGVNRVAEVARQMADMMQKLGKFDNYLISGDEGRDYFRDYKNAPVVGEEGICSFISRLNLLKQENPPIILKKEISPE